MTNEQIQEKIKQCEEELKNLREELDKPEQWIPQDGYCYYYYDIGIKDVRDTRWYNTDVDKLRLYNGVIFRTEKEAKEYGKYYLASKKAKKEFSKEEWNNDTIKKYYIWADTEYKTVELIVAETRSDRHNIEYFRTFEEAEDFIRKYKRFIAKELGYEEKDIYADLD